MALEVNASAALVGAVWAAVVLWLVGAVLTLRGISRQPTLKPAALAANHLTQDDAPAVSILVPARDEERRVLEASIRSMLAQDYANFEVVAVNDRSTDATPLVLRSIAQSDARLRVVEGIEPPAGWLGKPHAMHQAHRAARGVWMLATDADMIFDRTALRTAVEHALAGRYDAVTLLPRVDCLTFWERVFMPTFGWFMLIALPLERVNNPRRREALGVGGFFLIRRAALERVGGYGAVRGDVAEDLRMAEILKASGARLRVEFAPDLARTRMQTNLREIWEGFTKNLFAGAKFSLWQALGGALGVLAVSVAPPVVALVSGLMLAFGAVASIWLQLFIPACLVWVIQFVTFGVINSRWEIPLPYAMTVPLGHALFVIILLNSAIRIATGRGVTWKGRTLYKRAKRKG